MTSLIHSCKDTWTWLAQCRFELLVFAFEDLFDDYEVAQRIGEQRHLEGKGLIGRVSFELWINDLQLDSLNELGLLVDAGA